MEAFVGACKADAGGAQALCIDVSGSEHVFVLNAAGRLWSADARLLQLRQCETHYIACYETGLSVTYKQITYLSLHADASGSFVVVLCSLVVDGEHTARLFLLDLRMPVASDAGRPAEGQAPGGAVVERFECRCLPVDLQRLRSLPQLEVLRVAWLPKSPGHFAALTSDNTLSVYNTKTSRQAEQHIQLRCGGLAAPSVPAFSSELERTQMVDFAFGTGSLWETFTVYFLNSAGEVFSLCPVAPVGMRVRLRLLKQLVNLEHCGPGKDLVRWLASVFPLPLLSPGEQIDDSEGFWRQESKLLAVQRAAVAPGLALQGPVAFTSESDTSYSQMLLLSAVPEHAGLHIATSYIPTALLAFGAGGSVGDGLQVSVHILGSSSPCWDGSGGNSHAERSGRTQNATLVVDKLLLPDVEAAVPHTDILIQPDPRRAPAPALSPSGAFVPAFASAPCPSTPPAVVILFSGCFWLLQVPALAVLADPDRSPIAAASTDDQSCAVALPPAVVQEAVDLTDAVLAQLPSGKSLAGSQSNRVHVLASELCQPAVLGSLADGAAFLAPLTRSTNDTPARVLESSSPAGAARAQPPATAEALGQRVTEAKALPALVGSPARPGRPDVSAARSVSDSRSALRALGAGIKALQEGLVPHCMSLYQELQPRMKATVEMAEGTADSVDVLAALKAVQECNDDLESRLLRVVQKQNILNQRVDLQCSLFLTNLNIPGRLTGRERYIQEDIERRLARLQRLTLTVTALKKQIWTCVRDAGQAGAVAQPAEDMEAPRALADGPSVGKGATARHPMGEWVSEAGTERARLGWREAGTRALAGAGSEGVSTSGESAHGGVEWGGVVDEQGRLQAVVQQELQLATEEMKVLQKLQMQRDGLHNKLKELYDDELYDSL